MKRMLIRFFILSIYTYVVVLWDKHIFESVLIAESWSRATYNYFQDPRYQRLFGLGGTDEKLLR